MTTPATEIVDYSDVISLQVPFRIVKRGGRKEMQMPLGEATHCRTDSTLV